MTSSEIFNHAMLIEDQAEADAWIEKVLSENMEQHPEMDREKAERVLRSNIGYWAGYSDAETRERVERLFKCEHPVFGPIAKQGQVTPEQAFTLGSLGITSYKEAKEKGIL